MADQSAKFKIFISWSGKLAEGVTSVIRNWLPEIFDNIEPWMSSVDIEAGARGLDEIALRLDDTSFGIIVVTRENQNAPWLNFESGALSKRFTGQKSRVAPVLVDLGSPAQITGPLKQFQAVILDKGGTEKLLKTISATIGTDWAVVKKRFERAWDDLDKELTKVREHTARPATEGRRSTDDMIEELLTIVRDLQREREDQEYHLRPRTPARLFEAARWVNCIFRRHRITPNNVVFEEDDEGIIVVAYINEELNSEPVARAVKDVGTAGNYRVAVRNGTMESMNRYSVDEHDVEKSVR